MYIDKHHTCDYNVMIYIHVYIYIYTYVHIHQLRHEMSSTNDFSGTSSGPSDIGLRNCLSAGCPPARIRVIQCDLPPEMNPAQP